MQSKEELKKELGLGGTKTNNRIKLNEMTLDGEEGTFIYKKFLEPKNEDGSYPQVKLEGDSFEAVIIAIKRKLQYYSDTDGKVYGTIEFSSNDEQVTFYSSTGAIKDTPTNLRAKFPLLKTVAIVYIYSIKRDELMRLNCKGLGLQDEDNKGVNYKGLFQYLYSFGKEEMPFEYVTNVSRVTKEITKGRKTKTYYAMRFEQGELVKDVVIKEKILEQIDVVRGQFSKEVKEEVKKVEESQTDKFVADDVSYPDEEINPSDIPF